MKRSLIAVLAVLGLLVGATATALAVSAADRGDRAGGYRMHGMMRPYVGTDDRPRGPGTWMRGAVVRSEFGYLTEMVAHHQEAVAAAQQLQRSERPQMRAFGAAIVRTQSAQIAQMRTWLARWYPGRDTDVDYHPMMRDLSGLSGDRLDRAFLRDMIPHHMVAVMMSQQLLVRGLAEHRPVAELAVAIRDGQHREIFRMQRWLADWFDTGWTPGGRSHGGWMHGGWMHGGGADGRGWGMGPGMMW